MTGQQVIAIWLIVSVLVLGTSAIWAWAWVTVARLDTSIGGVEWDDLDDFASTHPYNRELEPS